MTKLNEIELDELEFKIEVVIYFLVMKDGYSFKLYNNYLSTITNEPNSNIVEYFEDIIKLVSKLKG